MKKEKYNIDEDRIKKDIHVTDLDLHDAETTTSYDKTLRELSDEKNLRNYTHLSSNEIRKLSILSAYAKRYKFSSLEDVINEFMSQRVSLKRLGRKEIVEVFKGERHHEEMMSRNQNNYMTPSR